MSIDLAALLTPSGETFSLDSMIVKAKAALTESGEEMPTDEEGILLALFDVDTDTGILAILGDEEASELMDSWVDKWGETG